MKPQKRVWDIQSFTVCKVVGMAFCLKDLRKVARKFSFSHDGDRIHEESSLHSKIVYFCGTDNPVARHTEKLIEERFRVPGKRLGGVCTEELVLAVTEGPEQLCVPLWAILWDLATRRSEDTAGLEAAVHGVIHMLEHQLLKEYWDSLIDPACGPEVNADDAVDIAALKRSLLELQQERTKLERTNDSLRRRIGAMEAEHATTGTRARLSVGARPACGCCAGRKMERLKAVLEEARSRNRELESEVAEVRREIGVLAAELTGRSSCAQSGPEDMAKVACALDVMLEGRCVALVGGIDSLECHYRRLIESMGGNFWRHNGDCSGGDKPLLDCIANVDLVVCPIEVNSHTAAKSVKRICKARGIPCCFPRSASLTGLKRAVEEHYSRGNAA